MSDDGKNDEALSLLLEIIKEESELKPFVLYQWSLCLHRKGSYEDGLMKINLAIEKFNFSEMFFILKNNLYEKMLQTELAVSSLELGLSKVHNSHTMNFLLANNYSKLHDNEKALHYINVALELKKDSGYLRFKSVLLDRLGRISESLDAIQQALQFSRFDPNNNMQASLIYFKKMMYLSSLEKINIALNSAENNPGFLLHKAKILFKIKDYVEAIGTVNDFLIFNKLGHEGMFLLSQIYFESSDSQSSLVWINRALAIEPENRAYLQMLQKLTTKESE